ncbi:MAG: hypothetical protein KDE14_14190, partial [Rhodobacteraceae bacterium]|nr:hypothetical protein [Paracoccaceae bacterium]
SNPGAVTLKRSGLTFERIDGAGAKTDVAADYNSVELTMNQLQNYFELSVGTGSSPDHAYAVSEDANNTEDDVRAYTGHGRFNFTQFSGIGVNGVGGVTGDYGSEVTNAAYIDNIHPNENYYDPLDAFLDVEDRETLSVEFDQRVYRVSMSLRRFGLAVGTTAQERARIRIFDTNQALGSQQVGSDLVVSACAASNADSNSFGSLLSFSAADFGATAGTYFDKVEILPEPALDSGDGNYLDSWSQFYVGYVRGCGSGENCSPDQENFHSSSTDSDIQNNCAVLALDTAQIGAGGTSTEVNPDQLLNTDLMRTFSNPANLQTAWINVSDTSPDDGSVPGYGPVNSGYDIYTGSAAPTSTSGVLSSSVGGLLYATEASDDLSGFSVGSAFGSTGNIETNGTSGDEDTLEKITVRFDERWDQAVVGLTNFNTNSNVRERARVRFYLGTTQVGSDWFIYSDDGNCSQTNCRVDAPFETADVGGEFDRIEVAAYPNETSSAGSTFKLRSMIACENGQACALSYGGDTGPPQRYTLLSCVANVCEETP